MWLHSMIGTITCRHQQNLLKDAMLVAPKGTASIAERAEASEPVEPRALTLRPKDGKTSVVLGGGF